jgi:hypothetical protein
MGGEVAVGHAEQAAELGEGEFRGGGEGGDNGKASPFVDDPVELEERLRVHGLGFFSVMWR